jgi:hypothetical protein
VLDEFSHSLGRSRHLALAKPLNVTVGFLRTDVIGAECSESQFSALYVDQRERPMLDLRAIWVE